MFFKRYNIFIVETIYLDLYSMISFEIFFTNKLRVIVS